MKINKIIKLTLKTFDSIYRDLAIKFGGSVYSTLFNVRARLRRKDITFTFIKKELVYIAQSRFLKRCFTEKYQNWNTYGNGLEKRARALGESYFLDLIQFKQNDIVIDCGANIGDLELYFIVNNISVRYLGIEPSPEEYACLCRNVGPQNSLNFGLWSEDKELEFYVSSANADSSLITPRKYDKKIIVSARRLDSLLTERVKLLKLEAEGAEPEVLIGSGNKLSLVEYISADLGFERGLQEESTLCPVINYLLSRDFELVTIGYPRHVALFKRKFPALSN
jgi:FkbM family methyltransferase